LLLPRDIITSKIGNESTDGSMRQTMKKTLLGILSTENISESMLSGIVLTVVDCNTKQKCDLHRD